MSVLYPVGTYVKVREQDIWGYVWECVDAWGDVWCHDCDSEINPEWVDMEAAA